MVRKKSPVPSDLKRFKFVSDPQVSPDGKSVLFVLTRMIDEGENGSYSSNIWIYSAGRISQLTAKPGRNTNPRWSPDSRRILFISSRKTEKENYTRLMTMSSSGRLFRTVLELKKGRLEGKIVNPTWTSSGKTILFLSEMRRKADSDVKVLSRIKYRMNDEGYFHDRRTHLYSIRPDGSKLTQLTSGEFDVEGYSSSADGNRVAYIANASSDGDFSLIRDIHVMSSHGGISERITDSRGPIYAVSWSHDGKRIAYVGHDLRRRLATNAGIWLTSSKGGPTFELTWEFDRSVGNDLNSDSRVSSADPSPVWDPEDRQLIFLATNGGSCHLYAIAVEGRILKRLTEGQRSVEGFSYSTDGHVLAYTSMDALSLADLYVRDRDTEERVTNFSNQSLSRIDLIPPERFTFKASDGAEIEGWVMKPRRQGPIPTVVEIHGGPRTAYGYCFMFEFQLLARHFAVLFTNPRGSTAYGEEFAAAIPTNYGDRDFKDIMESIDYLVRTRTADERRLGICGGSYGGWMTNWIIGHNTRFKAAITERSISNWTSFFGTSDIGHFFAEEEVGGVPWERRQHYLENSPLTYVNNMKTPVLIIHSEEDFRCPIEQAEQLFVSLKKLGRETTMLRFPNENHELSRSGKPNHRIERLNHITNWFKRYLTLSST